MNTIIKGLALFVLIIMMTACTNSKASNENQLYTKTNYVLGTMVTINLYDHGSDELLDLMFKRLAEIDSLMSVNIESSDISMVNQMAGIEPVQVSEDTYKVLKRSLEFAEMSQGYFDPSFGPVVNLWKIGTEEEAIPPEEALNQALELVDYKSIKLLDNRYVYVEKGMELDLGGIAKGFAADDIIELAKNNGVTAALVNIGGNVKTYGVKPDGNEFLVGIQNPFDVRNEYLGIMSVSDLTVVTSGDYERYFIENGIRYHHIFDKETGYPVRNNIGSVSIISQEAIDADALSTAIFALGTKKGLALIESLPGIECIFVLYDNEIIISSGIQDSFSLTDRSFTLLN